MSLHDDEPAGPPARARRDRRQIAVLAAILLGCFALYAPSLQNGFTWDDRAAALGVFDGLEHPLVSRLRPLDDYLTENCWPHTAAASRSWRPLTTLTFALRYAAVGDDPFVEHLANVSLHALAVLLCFAVARALGAGFAAAAAGALVFGAHAVHSEVVCSVVGRNELLPLTAGLAATLALRKGLVGSSRAFAGWLAVAALLLAVACLTKESGLAWTACAPVVAYAAARVPGGGSPSRPRRIAVGATALLIAAGYGLLRARMLASLPPEPDVAIGLLENPLLGCSPPMRAASGVLAWGYGLFLTALPVHLSIDYGPVQMPVVRGFGDPWFAGAVVVAVGFAALAWLVWRARRQPLVLSAGLVFVAFSLPVSNVLFPVFMHFADRVYTTPSLAAALLVAFVFGRCDRPGRTRLVLALAVGAWLALSVATAWPRNRVFRDDATLIALEVENNPRSVRMQLCAGVAAAEEGDGAAALHHYETAAALAPWLPQPWLELTGLLLAQGQVTQAGVRFERALAADPGELRRRGRQVDELRRRLEAARRR